MKRLAVVVAALAAACSGKFHAPPPLASTPMPTGNLLKPFDSNKPGLPRPEGMALLNGNAYVTLANYDAGFVARGPGLLAKVVPSEGVTNVVDLGGSGGNQCLEPGIVRVDGTLLYVSCGSDFAGRGQALVEVNGGTDTVSRSVSLPIAPSGIAFTSSRIWVGDAFTGDLYAVDKTTFTVVAGPVPVPCPADTTPHDPGYYKTINETLVVGNNLYALCSNSKDGVLSQLDPATGAARMQTAVGPIAVAMAETGDGRIAIVSGGENALRLVTVSPSALTVQTLKPFFSDKTSVLQDVRARDNFLYTAASGSNTVQKIDLDAAGGPKIVAEANMGDGANPWNVLPLDDDQALVSNQASGTLTGVKWGN
jgi:hypothetical protein